MSAAEQILSEVLRCLSACGLPAAEAYHPGVPLERREAVAASIQRLQSRPAGLDSYLGRQYEAETAAWRELYGRRGEVWIALEAYAPRASGCETLLEQAHDALTAGLAAGLRPGEMEWEAVCWDAETGMFRRRAILRCEVFLVAAASEESGELLDFRLKGVPES